MRNSLKTVSPGYTYIIVKNPSVKNGNDLRAMPEKINWACGRKRSQFLPGYGKENEQILSLNPAMYRSLPVHCSGILPSITIITLPPPWTLTEGYDTISQVREQLQKVQYQLHACVCVEAHLLWYGVFGGGGGYLTPW